jgi:hypothetical protein
MSKRIFFIVLIIFTGLIVFSTTMLAQEEKVHGKIITKAEADEMFGPVVKSVQVTKSMLAGLTANSGKHIMFNIVDGQLAILNEKRESVFPLYLNVADEQVFHLFSTSVVNELLNLTKEETVTVEQRKDVLTITSDGSTLEFSTLCPPYCL